MLLGKYNLISQMRCYQQKHNTGEAILQILSSLYPTSHDEVINTDKKTMTRSCHWCSLWPTIYYGYCCRWFHILLQPLITSRQV